MKRAPLHRCPKCTGQGFHAYIHFDGETYVDAKRRCLYCKGLGEISQLKAVNLWKKANLNCKSRSTNT